MYGAFLYQEDNEGCITPFLMGVYDSIESFKNDLPELEAIYAERQDGRTGKIYKHATHITYPETTSQIRVGLAEVIFSLEQLPLNGMHHYQHYNDTAYDG